MDDEYDTEEMLERVAIDVSGSTVIKVVKMILTSNDHGRDTPCMAQSRNLQELMYQKWMKIQCALQQRTWEFMWRKFRKRSDHR